MRYTGGMPALTPRPLGRLAPSLVLALAVALVTPACAGTCPTPADAVSVTPSTGCRGSGESGPAGLAGDPLTLVGGDVVFLMRADLAAIRQSTFGPLVERAFGFFMRAEFPREHVEEVLEAVARTQVVAIGVSGSGGFVMVAQGSFTDRDLGVVRAEIQGTRRQHVIHRRGENVGVVASGRYLILAERDSVEAVLDRIDGLEDPAPQTQPLLNAVHSVGAYHSYFAMLGVPQGELRRELQREREMRAIHGDLRCAALSVTQGSAGLEIVGRVHTITEAAAAEVRDLSESTRVQLVPELMREAAAIGEAAQALAFTVESTDAVLRWSPADEESRRFIEACSTIFEQHAARRDSYTALDDGSTYHPQPAVGPAVAPAP